MIQYDELPFLTENKDASEIALLYEDLCDKRTIFRESCKNFIDDFISDWATEDEPYDCDLFTEIYDQLGQPWIKNNVTAIWLDFNGNSLFYVNDEEVDINYFRDEELLQIVEQLSKL